MNKKLHELYKINKHYKLNVNRTSWDSKWTKYFHFKYVPTLDVLLPLTV